MTTFSESVISKIQNLRASSFFPKCLKFKLNLKKSARNCQKMLCFWHNCIWIAIVKLSLLRTRYFSSATSVLISSPKILHVNERDIFQFNWLATDQWIWERCCDADFKTAWEHLPWCLTNGPLKRDFLDNYLTTFSEPVISEIQKLWGSSFFSKYSKFNLLFGKAEKNWQKVFFFWDNCIWIAMVKLSLLGTGYFSWGANVLTSSTKISHVNKGDFFILNWLGSDQWIW